MEQSSLTYYGLTADMALGSDCLLLYVYPVKGWGPDFSLTYFLNIAGESRGSLLHFQAGEGC